MGSNNKIVMIKESKFEDYTVSAYKWSKCL